MDSGMDISFDKNARPYKTVNIKTVNIDSELTSDNLNNMIVSKEKDEVISLSRQRQETL